MARVTLDRSVKFKRLCRDLDLPRPYVRGLLETMWDCAHECGEPVLGDSKDVEHAAEWPGEQGVFFEALRSCGWIDELSSGLWEIHDYWDHAPNYVKKRRQRELERKISGEKLRTTADNGRQRQTTAPNGPTPTPTPTQHTTPPPPPSGGSGSLPGWCRKVKLPKGSDRASILAMVIDSIEAITGQPPNPQRCATDAKSLLSLWRALERPPPEEFAQDLKLVAKAARECPDPLFARDVRAEGWDGGVDRHRSVATLAVHKRWGERLEAAMRWRAQENHQGEANDPHSPVRHGRAHWSGNKKWCSRAGDFVPVDEWTPLQRGEEVKV